MTAAARLRADPGPTLADLARRARAGDRDAFGTLYERYAAGIRRYLLRRGAGSAELAEDLAADVFEKALAGVGRYEDRGVPFGSWLYRIARNHLIDHQRTRGRHAARPMVEHLEDSSSEAVAALARVLDRDSLDAALARLTSEQRRVLELRLLDGCAVAETAAIIGTTPDVVKKRQARGLAALRTLLGTSAVRGPA